MTRATHLALWAGICLTLAACAKKDEYPIGPQAGGAAAPAPAADAAPAATREDFVAKLQAQQDEVKKQEEAKVAAEAAELQAKADAAPPGPRPSVLLNAMTQPLQSMLQNSMQSMMSGGGPLQSMLPSGRGNSANAGGAPAASGDKPAEEAKPAE